MYIHTDPPSLTHPKTPGFPLYTQTVKQSILNIFNLEEVFQKHVDESF